MRRLPTMMVMQERKRTRPITIPATTSGDTSSDASPPVSLSLRQSGYSPWLWLELTAGVHTEAKGQAGMFRCIRSALRGLRRSIGAFPQLVTSAGRKQNGGGGAGETSAPPVSAERWSHGSMTPPLGLN